MSEFNSAFFKRELEFVKGTAYDTKQKPLRASTVIPVSTEAPSGIEYITYESFTHVGLAKVINDYANDFPPADVYGEEKTAKVRGIGSSYKYNDVEVKRARIANRPLNPKKVMSAKRAVESKIDSIAWNGDADNGLQGLIDYPGVTDITIPNGVSGSPLWVNKTPDEINADLEGMITGVEVATNDVEHPNMMIMPLQKYKYIKGRRMTDGNDKSILTYFLEQNPDVSIVPINELAGAGANGKDRMMCYPMDAEHLTLEIPQSFEQKEGTRKGMTMTIPCYAETGGVIVYYPLSVGRADNF